MGSILHFLIGPGPYFEQVIIKDWSLVGLTLKCSPFNPLMGSVEMVPKKLNTPQSSASWEICKERIRFLKKGQKIIDWLNLY